MNKSRCLGSFTCTLLCVELSLYWRIVISHKSHCPIFESWKTQLCRSHSSHWRIKITARYSPLSFEERTQLAEKCILLYLVLVQLWYKQLTLSWADWVYWMGNSEKQTFHRYIVIQILNYYLFVINSAEVSVLFLPHTMEKSCPKVSCREELHTYS